MSERGAASCNGLVGLIEAQQLPFKESLDHFKFVLSRELMRSDFEAWLPMGMLGTLQWLYSTVSSSC